MTIFKSLVARIQAVFRLSQGDALWMDSTERFRLAQVLPYVRGALLDIGRGYNNLVRWYGRGVGVDIYPWAGTDVFAI